MVGFRDLVGTGIAPDSKKTFKRGVNQVPRKLTSSIAFFKFMQSGLPMNLKNTPMARISYQQKENSEKKNFHKKLDVKSNCNVKIAKIRMNWIFMYSILPKLWQLFCWIFEDLSGAKVCTSCRSRQELPNFIPTNIYLQNLASIQPRMSLSKFGEKYSENK